MLRCLLCRWAEMSDTAAIEDFQRSYAEYETAKSLGLPPPTRLVKLKETTGDEEPDAVQSLREAVASLDETRTALLHELANFPDEKEPLHPAVAAVAGMKMYLGDSVPLNDHCKLAAELEAPSKPSRARGVRSLPSELKKALSPSFAGAAVYTLSAPQLQSAFGLLPGSDEAGLLDACKVLVHTYAQLADSKTFFESARVRALAEVERRGAGSMSMSDDLAMAWSALAAMAHAAVPSPMVGANSEDLGPLQTFILHSNQVPSMVRRQMIDLEAAGMVQFVRNGNPFQHYFLATSKVKVLYKLRSSGELVGFAISGAEGKGRSRQVFLYELHAKYRKQGLGRACLEEACADHGTHPIELNVHVGNVALGFYQRLGFKEVIDLRTAVVINMRREHEP